jgi:hypothetical protein
MAKVTALKKVAAENKPAVTNKSSRLPNIEIPAGIMQAVQKYIKNRSCSVNQFWKEAASLRLQVEDMQSARRELDRVLGQIAYAENKLIDLEEREREVHARELRMGELELSQEALYEERMCQLDQRAEDQDREYREKMAQFGEMVLKQEEEYNSRLVGIESRAGGKSLQSGQNPKENLLEREKELIRREARIEVQEEIALEKEKLWSVMYDAVIKLTRVCGVVK